MQNIPVCNVPLARTSASNTYTLAPQTGDDDDDDDDDDDEEEKEDHVVMMMHERSNPRTPCYSIRMWEE